ncbi:MAG: dihydroorotase, partial [Sphingobacteriaceae bacterium]
MKYLIKNVNMVNENEISNTDILIDGEFIAKIDRQIDNTSNATEINGEGLVLMPGAIDDQVHFREPGLTHKGEIYTEARAAVAGGVTSFMEQPNTNPPAITVEELEKKYTRASQCSLANYSFLMGTTNSNYDELQKVDYSKVAGVKIFMGSSTGNMLVDDKKALENVFTNVNAIIVT